MWLECPARCKMSEKMASTSSTGSMKLSCVRCRSKKLKCDKTYPECLRCQAAGTACSFPSRKRRHRSEGVRNDSRHQAIAMRQRTPASGITGRHAVAPLEFPTRLKDSGHDTSLSGNAELWVYKMVNGAKKHIENLKVTGRFMSPSSPEAVRPAVDRALIDLNNALGTLRERMPRSHRNAIGAPEYTASLEDLERHIELFLVTIRYIPFSPFELLLDAHVLKALPRLFASPYVQIDPAMKVVYYCAIFFGQSCGGTMEQSTTSRTYYNCIVIAQDWLKSATGTEMDLLAAMMTSWLAVNNFDYHLSWSFHREACRFAGILGLHLVDKSLPSDHKDEEEKEGKRCIYWYLAQTDLMFRLWYDKPSALEGPVLDVRPPSVIRPAPMRQLSACETVLQAIWTRAVVVLLEFFDSVGTDGTVQPGGENDAFDSCCVRIEDLLADWDLMSVVKSMGSDDLMTWFCAETVIALYSSIVFMRRKTAITTTSSVHPQALKASRAIISIVIEFSSPTISFSGAHRVFNLLFISFYPFCAFFTLYQKITTAPSLEDCENDILSLEAVVREMTRLTSTRSDFIPIANVMDALNRVSRAIHGGQQRDPESAASLEAPKPINQSTTVGSPPQHGLQTVNMNFQTPDTQKQSTDNTKSFFGLPFEMGPDVALPSLGSSTTAPTEGLPNDGLGGLQEPVDFVRAIEEEFLWRNWHDNWWGNGLGDIPILGGNEMPGATQGA